MGAQDQLLDCVIEGLQCIKTYVEEAVIEIRSLEENALAQLLRQLIGLKAVLTKPSANCKILLQLLRQLIQNVRLPIDTQSADGIQVLDVLATQNLDFDHVFILGMNEGHFPVHSSPTSFIPYNLRKGYNLPTADQHQAALYAYHFYRLLQRARQVYITYSTRTTAGKLGEKSRYLWQLLYESNLCLHRHVVAQPIYLAKIQPINIAKKGAVLKLSLIHI